MASKNPKSAHGTPFPSDEGLTELGRTLLRGQPGVPDMPPARPTHEARAEVELCLADLVSDDNGEVVFFNDSGARSLGITTPADVVANGRAEPHVTAAGADVTGYRFVTFDNGLTLYFQPDLDVVVERAPARPG